VNFSGDMRLVSLETLCAAAGFAIFSFRMGRGTSDPLPSNLPRGLELEIHERGRSRRVEVKCPAVVGRSTGADILIMDPEVSRRHAGFESEGDGVFLSDLQSRNGTFLNGQRIRESIEVRPGDEIDIGTARIAVLGTRTWN